MAFTPGTPSTGAPLESDVIRDNFDALSRANDFRLIPTDPATLQVLVEPGTVISKQDSVAFTTTRQTVNLASHITGSERAILIFIDTASGAALAGTGSPVVVTWGNPATFPPFNNAQLVGGAWNFATHLPIAWVRLRASATNILATDILDVRPFLQPLKTLVDMEDVSQGEAEAFNDTLGNRNLTASSANVMGTFTAAELDAVNEVIAGAARNLSPSSVNVMGTFTAGELDSINDISAGPARNLTPSSVNVMGTFTAGELDAINEVTAGATRNLSPSSANVMGTFTGTELDGINQTTAGTNRTNMGMPAPSATTPYATTTDAQGRALFNPGVNRAAPTAANPFVTFSELPKIASAGGVGVTTVNFTTTVLGSVVMADLSNVFGSSAVTSALLIVGLGIYNNFLVTHSANLTPVAHFATQISGGATIIRQYFTVNAIGASSITLPAGNSTLTAIFQ